MLYDDIMHKPHESVINLMGGLLKELQNSAESAERFVLSPSVARAAQLTSICNPSAILSVLPQLHLPFDQTWIEWATLDAFRDKELAPLASVNERTPIKCGALCENYDENIIKIRIAFSYKNSGDEESNSDQVLFEPPITCVLLAKNNVGVNTLKKLTELSGYRSFVRSSSESLDKPFTGGKLFNDGDVVTASFDINDESMKRALKDELNRGASSIGGRVGFSIAQNNEFEMQAYITLCKHFVGIASPGCNEFIKTTQDYVAAMLPGNRGAVQHVTDVCQMLDTASRDTSTEIPMVVSSLLLLNSRNCIRTEDHDFRALNAKRVKKGKNPLFSYREVKLDLSRGAARRGAANGMSEQEAREHMVRGHFKLRKTGVFWWSPHARGDAANGVVRHSLYRVKM